MPRLYNEATPEDLALIAELKAERQRLKRQLEQLTDRAIADKFELPVWEVRHVTAARWASK